MLTPTLSTPVRFPFPHYEAETPKTTTQLILTPRGTGTAADPTHTPPIRVTPTVVRPQIFAEANTGKFRNSDRAVLNLAEFTQAVQSIAAWSHGDHHPVPIAALIEAGPHPCHDHPRPLPLRAGGSCLTPPWHRIWSSTAARRA